MADDKQVSANGLLALGIIGGLLGIYLVGINSIIGPLIACLGGACAIIWGANAIRSVAGYGLGTGVPSIGYMSLGIGVLGGLSGLAIVTLPALKSFAIAGPIFALIISMIIGFIVALLAKKIVGMKIPVLLRNTTEIAGAGALSVIAFSAALAGAYDITSIAQAVILPGYIALFFILNCMAIQEPFNACLGPNEDQRRTLVLAVANAFLAIVVVGLLAIPTGYAALLLIIVGFVGWLCSYKKFLKMSNEAAASVIWSGLWPKIEDQ
jgi:tetrahydromethanopterin S-methyltransferase subunit C